MALPEPAAPLPGRGVEDALVHRDRLHQLIVRFEKVLASPAARPGWLDAVTATLRDLDRCFRVHVEVTEGEGGLYQEIVAAEPRLAHRIEVLRAEHTEISEAIADACRRADSRPKDTGELRERLTKLLGRLVRHRQKGADLLYEAYEVDLGGLD